MQAVRQADAHRLELRPREQLAKAAAPGRAGECSQLSDAGAVDVGNGDDLRARVIGIDPGMAAAEVAQSDHPYPQPHGLSGMRHVRKSPIKAASASAEAAKKAAPASGEASDGSPSVPVGERSAKSW